MTVGVTGVGYPFAGPGGPTDQDVAAGYRQQPRAPLFGDAHGYVRQPHHGGVGARTRQRDGGGQSVVVTHAEHDVASPTRSHRPGLDRHMVGTERSGQAVDLCLPGFDRLTDRKPAPMPILCARRIHLQAAAPWMGATLDLLDVGSGEQVE